MAMSFVRPDPSSPAWVADAAFGTSRRGFDQGEVREFLRTVAAELGRLQERERFLERELRTAKSNPDLESVELDEETITRLLGEETARVLTTARESAAQIRQKAEQSAAQLLSEAGDESARMREDAEVEASRRRTDAASDAEAELSMAKQQGREMVNEARAYRERVLSELARRRELAREQIEQLLIGRDRLMQSFEHARLVAVDVVAELQPLGEPDEYVNLSPTTGPVPMMLPNSPRPSEFPEEHTEDIEDISGTDAGTGPSDRPADDNDTEAVVSDAADTDDEELDVTVDVTEMIDDDAADSEGIDPNAGAVDAEVDHVADDVAGEVEQTVEVRDDVVVDLFARLRADASLTAVDDPADVMVDPVDAPEAIAHLSSVPEPAPQSSGATGGAPTAGADAPSDEYEVGEVTPFDQRDIDITPLIVASAKKLKRVLADEQNEVLDGLRRREPVRMLGDLLPEPAEHLDRYRVAIIDDLLAAANAGASLVTPGRVARLKKADAAKAAGAGEAVLGEWLIVPLRERLDRCVIDGDGDNAAIAKRVRAVYREWKTQHIDEQLDDVICAAHGQGVFSAIGQGTAVEWVADPSRHACADCDDNTLGGAVAAGEVFPTGQFFPPAHLGCRCLLLPTER